MQILKVLRKGKRLLNLSRMKFGKILAFLRISNIRGKSQNIKIVRKENFVYNVIRVMVISVEMKVKDVDL